VTWLLWSADMPDTYKLWLAGKEQPGGADLYEYNTSW
jgi:hypothetical protein